MNLSWTLRRSLAKYANFKRSLVTEENEGNEETQSLKEKSHQRRLIDWIIAATSLIWPITGLSFRVVLFHGVSGRALFLFPFSLTFRLGCRDVINQHSAAPRQWTNQTSYKRSNWSITHTHAARWRSSLIQLKFIFFCFNTATPCLATFLE